MPLPEIATARVPLLQGMRLEVVQAINASDGGSNARLFQMLRQILGVSRHVTSMQNTLDAF